MNRDNDPNWTLKTPRQSRASSGGYYAPQPPLRQDRTLFALGIAMTIVLTVAAVIVYLSMRQ